MLDGYLAAQIRGDGIDVLVDLDGHTPGNRLTVFFMRPAPVQATWLGYLATTGVPAMDFRLTDSRADPPGIADGLHTEALWRLPATAWCYEPYPDAPAVSALPAAANGHVTFVSQNYPAKVTPSVLELWARILRELPTSRLILYVSGHRGRMVELRSFFAARGINPVRIELSERRPLGEYLQLYGRADIALDSWPCVGGTTTCDALWMGVPVVTLTAEASYSRTGGSLLPQVGLDECVTHFEDDFVAQATRLAQDTSRLSQVRAELRDRMLGSSLTDAKGFAGAVEAALEGMFDQKKRKASSRQK